MAERAASPHAELTATRPRSGGRRAARGGRHVDADGRGGAREHDGRANRGVPYGAGRPDASDADRQITGLAPDVGDRSPWRENEPRPVMAREKHRGAAEAVPSHAQRLRGRVEPVDGGPREDLDEPGGPLPGEDRPPERSGPGR